MESACLSESVINELEQQEALVSEPGRQRFFWLSALAAATTLNHGDALDRWLIPAEHILGVEAIDELMLQTLLFAGYPKTIEALKHVRKLYPQPSAGKVIPDTYQAGMATSKAIYGSYHDRLLEHMDQLHPDLTQWMITQGYGRVLSRPGLSLQEREIGVLASLMASGMVNQYRAHLRGALFAGVSRDDIIWFTNTFNAILTAEARPLFEAVSDQYLKVKQEVK